MADLTTTPLTLADLVDTSIVRDDGTIGMTGRVIRGPRVVAEHVARGWLSQRGSLKHAPNTGVDIRRLQNSTLGPGDLARWQALLVGAAREVDFVRNAYVSITQDGNRWRIRGSLVLVDGQTYPLAVVLGEAGSVVAEIGGTL